MALIRRVTTIVPSTDTAWSVKPHNNKEAADVGDLAQARKAELQHHSPMEKRTLCATLGSREQLSAKPFVPIPSRQSRNKRLRTRCLRPLPSFAATRDRLHSCGPLGNASTIHTTVRSLLYCAALAPQQQT